MRFEGVDFPSAILDAQAKGELVIFAGAGVSMAPPSDLPDFPALANELANGTVTLREDSRGALLLLFPPPGQWAGRLSGFCRSCVWP